ncbi:MAG: tRNA-intron lyase [Candidatus Micrarchaeota archaeon]
MKSDNSAELVENKVLIEHRPSQDRLHQKGFGERKERHLVLDLKEALYLLEKEKLKITIQKNGKRVSARQLRTIAGKKEKNFFKKFVVFSDLRSRGYVVKTGFKFGFDFRVYPKGKRPGEAHTQFVIEVKTQDEFLKMPEFSRLVRMAQTLHTAPLVAIVDAENEINYYSVGRLVP